MSTALEDYIILRNLLKEIVKHQESKSFTGKSIKDILRFVRYLDKQTVDEKAGTKRPKIIDGSNLSASEREEKERILLLHQWHYLEEIENFLDNVIRKYSSLLRDEKYFGPYWSKISKYWGERPFPLVLLRQFSTEGTPLDSFQKKLRERQDTLEDELYKNRFSSAQISEALSEALVDCKEESYQQLYDEVGIDKMLIVEEIRIVCYMGEFLDYISGRLNKFINQELAE